MAMCSFYDSNKLTALVCIFLIWYLSLLLGLPPDAPIGIKNPILSFVGLNCVLGIEWRTFHLEEFPWALALLSGVNKHYFLLFQAGWFTGIIMLNVGRISSQRTNNENRQLEHLPGVAEWSLSFNLSPLSLCTSSKVQCVSLRMLSQL